MFEFIVGILQTVSKQYHFRFDCAEKPVFTRLSEPLLSRHFPFSFINAKLFILFLSAFPLHF